MPAGSVWAFHCHGEFVTIIKAANRQGVGGIGNISFSEFTFQQLIFNVRIVFANLEYVKILVCFSDSTCHRV